MVGFDVVVVVVDEAGVVVVGFEVVGVEVGIGVVVTGGLVVVVVVLVELVVVVEVVGITGVVVELFVGLTVEVGFVGSKTIINKNIFNYFTHT